MKIANGDKLKWKQKRKLVDYNCKTDGVGGFLVVFAVVEVMTTKQTSTNS